MRMRAGRSSVPLSGFLKLLDFAADDVPFQRAEVIDEENAVQVIDFVLEGAGQKLLTGKLDALAVLILRFHDLPCGAGNGLAETGDAEATFFAGLLSFAEDDFRIDDDDLVGLVFAQADVDDRDLLAEPDLRSGQPDAFGGIHRLEHIGDRLVQFRRIELSDGIRLAAPGRDRRIW